MKKGNGGYSHIIIILVGVVLALLLLGVFAVRHSINTAPIDESPITISALKTERPTHLPCGITVLDPQPNRQVQVPIVVRGYVNGCGWDNSPITLGYVKVLNERGQVISATYPLLRKDANFNLPAYFEASIPSVIGSLQTPSGTLFFTSNGGAHPDIVEVPISF